MCRPVLLVTCGIRAIIRGVNRWARALLQVNPFAKSPSILPVAEVSFVVDSKVNLFPKWTIE